MCGIAGALGSIDSIVADAVRRMNSVQAHRGPDGDGFWSDRAVASEGGHQGAILAHRRLAIIDLSSAGSQPMTDPETGNVIAFNGEIYNYRELRAELEGLGSRFRSHTDTEVLLIAYRHWGDRLVERLRGIFAFVLWDPARRVALMARDQLGVKPLYWSLVRRSGQTTILFSSELRAMLESGLVARRLDPAGLESYLWNGFVVGPGTIVKGVQLLAAGHMASISVDAPGLATQAYWRIPAPSATIRDVEPLRETLREAVRIQLMSDVPLGVFLSGGIDSSAVAALAVRSAGQAQVRTFTVGFDEARYDESPHARAVAQALGTDHQEIRLSQDAFKSGLSAALESIDQPTFDAVNTYFVSRAVREAGIKVALAGTGGDELFGGYRSFRDIPAAQRWALRLSIMPERPLRALAAVATRLMARGGGAVPPQTRWGKLGDVLATRGRLLDLYQLSYGLFTPDFQQRLRGTAPGGQTRCGLPAAVYDDLAASAGDASLLHAISVLELRCFIGERLLRDTDAASMAVGLEARVPLLDHRVIERAAELAPDVRFQPLGGKTLLRRLALDGLDPAIFDRPKAGFELPFDRWCRDGLKDEMSAAFNDAGLCASAGLDRKAVQALWQGFQEGTPGLYWSRVWSLYVLLWWCQRYRLELA